MRSRLSNKREQVTTIAPVSNYGYGTPFPQSVYYNAKGRIVERFTYLRSMVKPASIKQKERVALIVKNRTGKTPSWDDLSLMSYEQADSIIKSNRKAWVVAARSRIAQ